MIVPTIWRSYPASNNRHLPKNVAAVAFRPDDLASGSYDEVVFHLEDKDRVRTARGASGSNPLRIGEIGRFIRRPG